MPFPVFLLIACDFFIYGVKLGVCMFIWRSVFPMARPDCTRQSI